MSKNIVSLTKKLIAVKSTFENKKSLEKALNFALKELKEFTIERFKQNSIPSVLVYKESKRPQKFKIILNGHLDIVPGKEYQYTARIKGNKLYGVGSMDMKANVACLVKVFKDTADKVSYPLGLQMVTDEEIGGFDGTKHQIDRGVRADFVIAGEPTNFDIAHKAKGILNMKISATGKTAHGAYPWRGDNAIWKMNEFLKIIKKKYSIPKKEKWVTTLNLSRIETTNKSFNKIPDDCEIWLDIRHVSKEGNTIIKEIKKILPRGFKMEITSKEPALLTDRKNQYLRKLEKSIKDITGKKTIVRGANGSSDARHFVPVNCPGVEFGPIGGDIGGDNEWVDIPSLEKYYQILKKFLLSVS